MDDVLVQPSNDGHIPTHSSDTLHQHTSLPDTEHICRVCRFPGTDEDPLFHPCKCAGSMKFVHQLCLEEWLAHSGKQHCEICTHPFVFSSIYADSAPVTISWHVALYVMIQRAYSSMVLNVRIAFAACLWLFWVPYVTLYTWRLFLDPSSITERMINYGAPAVPQHSTFLDYLLNNTISSNTTIFLFLPFRSLGISWKEPIKAIIFDILEGQKITCVGILVGIAFVFIKEYIVVNTPRDANGQLIGVGDQNADVIQDDPIVAAPQDEELHQAPLADDQLAPLEQNLNPKPDISAALADQLDETLTAEHQNMNLTPTSAYVHSDHSSISLNDSTGSSFYNTSNYVPHAYLDATPLHLSDSETDLEEHMASVLKTAAINLQELVQSNTSDKKEDAVSAPDSLSQSHNDSVQLSPSTSADNVSLKPRSPIFLHHDSPRTTYKKNLSSIPQSQLSESESSSVSSLEEIPSPSQTSSRYELRPRRLELKSASGTSSASNSQSCLHAVEKPDGRTPLSHDPALHHSGISKLSLRRKSSQYSFDSNSSSHSSLTSLSGLGSSSKSNTHIGAMPLQPSSASTLDELKRKYADQITSLENEVERRRLKGKSAAVYDSFSTLPLHSSSTMASSSSIKRSPFESFEHAHSNTNIIGASGQSNVQTSELPGYVDESGAFTRKTTAPKPDWHDSLANLRRRILENPDTNQSVELAEFNETTQFSQGIAHGLSSSMNASNTIRQKNCPEFSTTTLLDKTQSSSESILQNGTYKTQSSLMWEQSASTQDADSYNLISRVNEKFDKPDSAGFAAKNRILFQRTGTMSSKLPLVPFENEAVLPRPDARLHNMAIASEDFRVGSASFREPLPQSASSSSYDYGFDAQDKTYDRGLDNLLETPAKDSEQVPPAEQQPEQQPEPVDVPAQAPAPVLPAPARQAGFMVFFGNNPEENVNFPDEGALNVNVGIDNGNIVAEVNGDINAFLEIIGARGSFLNLVYNVVAVHALVFVCIAVGIWIPFLTGKVMFLIFRDVYGPMVERLISLVTSMLQVVTDPILDPIVDSLFILGSWLSSDAVEFLNTILAAMNLPGLLSTVNHSIFNATSAVIANATSTALNSSTAHAAASAISSLAINETIKAVVTPTINGIVTDNLTATLETTALLISDQISNGTNTTAIQAVSKTLLPDMLDDTALMTLIGYTTYVILFLSYANHTNLFRHPYAQTAILLFKATIRHSILSKKFMFFITAEIVAFPIFCGILIDFCTLPFFSHTGLILARQTFFIDHPWTALFLHWLIGTTFMFQVAIYITFVREIVRPGVMWFMRDPNDPRFNPMQDILERPFLTQARKLGVGALMYGGLILGVVGGSVGIIVVLQYLFAPAFGIFKIFPLRWEFHDHYSEFPLDLLLFYFFVPLMAKLIDLKSIVRYLFEEWLRRAAAALDLTHFLFGGELPAEDDGSDVDQKQDIRYMTIDSRGRRRRRKRSAYFRQTGAVKQRIMLDNGEAGSEKDTMNQDEWVDEVEDVDSDQHETKSHTSRESRRHHFTFPEHRARGKYPDETVQDEWEDVTDSEAGSVDLNGNALQDPVISDEEFAPLQPRQHMKPTNYMRVPNHDHIEVIPGDKVMLFMRKDEAIFGRATETPEEVASNWTKVYVPNRVFLRVYILLVGQLVTIVLSLVTAWAIPLIIGRAAFQFLSSLVIVRVPIPREFQYTLPISTNRIDLPIHDLHSYLAGVAIINLIALPTMYLYRMIRDTNLFEEFSYTRQHHTVPTPNDPNLLDLDNLETSTQSATTRITKNPNSTAVSRLTIFYQCLVLLLKKYTPEMQTRHLRLAHLLACLGIVMPLLVGLVIDIYVMIPFRGNSKSINVIFFVHDWTSGVIVTRIIYYIIMAGPDNRFKALIAETVANGFEQDFTPILQRLIYPVIATTSILLPLPFISTCVAQILGQKMYFIRDTLFKYGIGLIFAMVMSYELILTVHAWFARWSAQIRDEHYRVGRRLHNADEIPASNMGVVQNIPTERPADDMQEI
ncbi:hypothetical protein BDV3_000502 [Batrachochytrium dendrobatidis]